MIFSSSAVIAPGVDRLRLVEVHVNPNLWSKVVSWLLVTFKSDQVQRPLPKFKKIQFFTCLLEITNNIHYNCYQESNEQK